MWYVYILECADQTLYTGITTDIKRRLEEHNRSKKGARYTRPRRPVVLKYKRGFRGRAKAQVEEYRIKKLSRQEKDRLIKSQ